MHPQLKFLMKSTTTKTQIRESQNLHHKKNRDAQTDHQKKKLFFQYNN